MKAAQAAARQPDRGGEIEIPPHVLDALDYCRSLVDGPTEDLDRMFRLGAAAVFRKIAKGDPHRIKTIDAVDFIGQEAGLFDADHRQSIIDAGFRDAQKPAPAGKASAIITPADLETFFAGWQLAIAEALDRGAKWREFTATVHAKMVTQEIGRNVAERQLSLIATELELFPASNIADKVTAALDGMPTMNGHDAAPSSKGPDEYGTTTTHLPATIDDTSAIVPATFITPASWPREAPPSVEWLAASRIPRGDVTTLSGDGGAGKSDSAIQLGEAVARDAQVWFGHEVATGPVLFISAEEPERELRRRIWLHSQRDRYDSNTLASLRLWFPDKKSGDAIMAVADRYTGIMRPTRIMQEIAAAIRDLAPVLVIVDNVAATFAGNQNDRVMVRSYVNLWRQIAHGPSKPAVLLLDHPSLSGMTNNTGRGGSMDWRNAVRSALWLHAPNDGAEADRGIRVLETTKSNYGPPGNPLRLVWADGGLQLEHAPTSLHRLAKDAECDATFLRLLDEREGQGRHVSSEARAATYAPKAFADMPNNGDFRRNAFAAAMERLLQAGKIHQVFEGPASRPRGRLVRKAATG